ncbi:olfactory receptor 11L1-like [Ascaphus truei]|uniref:olfactory receptor 11L1-like n=1 Tax=Ascaphus truei TaxID=8439 RepID=UPI003F59EFC7
MHTKNQTMVKEFLLLGFQNLHTFKILVFVLLIIIYVATVVANLLIIALISTSHQLQSPMYFFLSHLSLSDVLICTNIAPFTLQVILADGSPISASGCITQLHFFSSSAIIECCLLTVMSYDRYLAICDPLHYTSIMNHRLPYYLVIWSWMTGFVTSLINTVFILQLQFCGPNVIDHFFCDLAPLLELSCSDISLVEMLISIEAILIGVLPFIFVIVSYSCIFITILRIPSTTGRQKAFSTCSVHLAVVFTYYGTLIVIYVAPSRGKSLNLNKVLSLLNTMMTPLFNPIIYSLRNKEIRTAIRKLILIRHFFK